MARGRMTRREFVRDTAVAAVAVTAAAGMPAGAPAAAAAEADTSKIVNYNPNMEYRRCGKTNLMVSAVALGGHCKQIAKVLPPGINTKGIWGVHIDEPSFQQNRLDVVSRLIDVGMNWIDACTIEEVKAHNRALKGRRDKMYLACSWYEREMRNPAGRTAKALLEVLDWGMKDAALDYCDLWRIVMHEQSQNHSNAEVDEMMKALETAKKQGKTRFIGLSSHSRPHIQWMIETYSNVLDVIVTPYTAKTKEAPKDSLFAAIKKHDMGFFGIKPFASGSLFKAGGAPAGPDAEEDDRRARLAIRHILCNPVITAPIPGMITTHQVDNVALAVKESKEKKELTRAEFHELQAAMDTAWASLPHDYQWLKDWEHV